jgi:hypothetical protein
MQALGRSRLLAVSVQAMDGDDTAVELAANAQPDSILVEWCVRNMGVVCMPVARFTAERYPKFV